VKHPHFPEKKRDRP